jgi:hypothetical protein
MSFRILFLVGGVLAFWLLVALPMRAFGGGDAVVAATLILALLCLVPAALTLFVADRALGGPPEQRLLVVFGGTGFRMLFVLAGGWFLRSQVPFLRDQPGYWLWLVVFYLVTLGLEVALLLAGGRAESDATPRQGAEAGREPAAVPPVVKQS